MIKNKATFSIRIKLFKGYIRYKNIIGDCI
jgi:hypothetical protein